MAGNSLSASSSTPANPRRTLTDRVNNRVREARSLRTVYHEMKATYRRYRKETGKPAVPELKEAVQAFKRGPTVTSLVGVATFLDDRGLLGW